MQQGLALSLFHLEVLCKASAKRVSVESQHRLDMFWSTMIKALVKHAVTKSTNKVDFLLAGK